MPGYRRSVLSRIEAGRPPTKKRPLQERDRAKGFYRKQTLILISNGICTERSL